MKILVPLILRSMHTMNQWGEAAFDMEFSRGLWRSWNNAVLWKRIDIKPIGLTNFILLDKTLQLLIITRIATRIYQSMKGRLERRFLTLISDLPDMASSGMCPCKEPHTVDAIWCLISIYHTYRHWWAYVLMAAISSKGGLTPSSLEVRDWLWTSAYLLKFPHRRSSGLS